MNKRPKRTETPAEVRVDDRATGPVVADGGTPEVYRTSTVEVMESHGRSRGIPSRRRGLVELMPDIAKVYWLRSIACADLEIGDFFVSAGKSSAPEIVATCKSCPVRRECVEHVYGGASGDRPITHGYFGGFSADQRKKMTLAEALERVEDDVVEPIVEPRLE